MDKQIFKHIIHCISNIMSITYHAHKINLVLTYDDEQKILFNIKKIHSLSPSFDKNDLLSGIKSSLVYNKEYAGGSLGDIIMYARLALGQLTLTYPKYSKCYNQKNIK